MTNEIWRPIAGWEGVYEVSDHGRVRSLTRIDSIGRHVRGKILGYSTRRDGSARVHLCARAERTPHFVSALVATAFMPPRPPGHVISHLDGDAANNAVSNLQWRTPQEIALTRKGGPERDADGYIKPTRLVAINDETGETLHFRSVGAARRAGFSPSAVSKCLLGHNNAHKGFRWAIDTAYQKDATHANHS